MNSAQTETETLCKELIYMSESDYPFTVELVPATNRIEIEKIILSKHAEGSQITELTIDQFFNKVITNYANAGDEFLSSQAEQYSSLLHYIKENAADAYVLRCGSIEIGVYVVTIWDTESLLLKTVSIET